MKHWWRIWSRQLSRWWTAHNVELSSRKKRGGVIIWFVASVSTSFAGFVECSIRLTTLIIVMSLGVKGCNSLSPKVDACLSCKLYFILLLFHLFCFFTQHGCWCMLWLILITCRNNTDFFAFVNIMRQYFHVVYVQFLFIRFLRRL